MNEDLVNIIRIDRAGVKPAVATLARASRDYALLTHYFPDEVKREKISYYFVSARLTSALATAKSMPHRLIWKAWLSGCCPAVTRWTELYGCCGLFRCEYLLAWAERGVAK